MRGVPGLFSAGRSGSRGAAARELGEAGVEAILIGFLFSSESRPRKTRRRDRARRRLPDVFVTPRREVSPQFREFERFTTPPPVGLHRPQVLAPSAPSADELRAGRHRRTARSGPPPAGWRRRDDRGAAGDHVLSGLGRRRARRRPGWANMRNRQARHRSISAGTRADIGIIRDRRLAEADAPQRAKSPDFPVMPPMIDITHDRRGRRLDRLLDRGKAFRVGPQSAGGRPAPRQLNARRGACPPVTDANLVLGRLFADNLLCGRGCRSTRRRRRASSANWPAVSGHSPEETAEGALTVLNDCAGECHPLRARCRRVSTRAPYVCRHWRLGPSAARGQGRGIAQEPSRSMLIRHPRARRGATPSAVGR